MIIYLDMDDVVADFKGHARSILRNPEVDGDRFAESEWQKLRDNPRLYLNLPLKEGANDLVAWCLNYASTHKNVEVRFLTAIPRNNDMFWSFNDKFLWAQRYFPNIPIFFGPYSHDKHVHCQPGDILVDDRTGNCRDWTAAGGLAHIYKNWPDCKQWLEEILNGKD